MPMKDRKFRAIKIMFISPEWAGNFWKIGWQRRMPRRAQKGKAETMVEEA